jgi:hypothetical protein
LRKLAKVLNLPEEVRSRLKALRDFDGDFTELFTLITDPEAYMRVSSQKRS